MAISKVTKDLRRLLDAQNIPWEDHSGFSTERTWIPLDDGSVITPSGIEYGVTRGFPLKLEVSIIHSIDDYAFGKRFWRCLVDMERSKYCQELCDALELYGKTWTDRSNACVEHIYFKSRGNWVSVLYGDDIRGFPHKFLVWEMSNYSYSPRVMDVEKIVDKYF